MRVITVRQPFAWAIIFGGKPIENRLQPWTYRGPLAIHAGLTWSTDGQHSPLVRAAWTAAYPDAGAEPAPDDPDIAYGAVIGIVTLTGSHRADACRRALRTYCSPWADGLTPDGRPYFHLKLTDPQPLSDPIPARGQRGLWRPTPDLAAAITASTKGPRP